MPRTAATPTFRPLYVQVKHLLDWATVSDQCVDNCFYGDNIHLRPAGQQFYADQVWAAIGR